MGMTNWDKNIIAFVVSGILSVSAFALEETGSSSAPDSSKCPGALLPVVKAASDESVEVAQEDPANTVSIPLKLEPDAVISKSNKSDYSKAEWKQASIRFVQLLSQNAFRVEPKDLRKKGGSFTLGISMSEISTESELAGSTLELKYIWMEQAQDYALSGIKVVQSNGEAVTVTKESPLGRSGQGLKPEMISSFLQIDMDNMESDFVISRESDVVASEGVEGIVAQVPLRIPKELDKWVERLKWLELKDMVGANSMFDLYRLRYPTQLRRWGVNFFTDRTIKKSYSIFLMIVVMNWFFGDGQSVEPEYLDGSTDIELIEEAPFVEPEIVEEDPDSIAITDIDTLKRESEGNDDLDSVAQRLETEGAETVVLTFDNHTQTLNISGVSSDGAGLNGVQTLSGAEAQNAFEQVID